VTVSAVLAVLAVLAGPVQPQHPLAPALHCVHVCILMQPFTRLASCLFGTIVELFGCLQCCVLVVFASWLRCAVQPPHHVSVSSPLSTFVAPPLPLQVTAFYTMMPLLSASCTYFSGAFPLRCPSASPVCAHLLLAPSLETRTLHYHETLCAVEGQGSYPCSCASFCLQEWCVGPDFCG
jgi:hypothetical protein